MTTDEPYFLLFKWAAFLETNNVFFEIPENKKKSQNQIWKDNRNGTWKSWKTKKDDPIKFPGPVLICFHIVVLSKDVF